MRHLVFDSPGKLHWRETPDLRINGDRDVIVRPLAVARCDLDPAIATGAHAMQEPFAMGHEMVGEIVDVGDGAGTWSPGQCVIVPFQISCGDCSNCVAGRSNACTSVPHGSAFGLGRFGDVDYGGALADLVRVPYADHLLLALPDGLDPVAAAGIPDNVSDGYRCVAGPLREWPGAPVLVVAGLAPSVGLYAVAAAIALGAERVVYIDHDPKRLSFATEFGAEAREIPVKALHDLRLERSFPIVVDACVFERGRTFALKSTAPCGTCTSVSGGAREATVPLSKMYFDGIRYEIGRVHARAIAPAVIDLVTSGRLNPAAIVTDIVAFDDAPEAMNEPSVKMVFVP